MPRSDDNTPKDFTLHHLSWADFDDLAHGAGGARVVCRLGRAERSRRLLLLRALVDETAKVPDLYGPLPSPESAWELLERVQARTPRVLDLILTHPYTGSWAGYTTRLIHHQITGVCPLWVHIGHIHALAAAAAIRAGLLFRTSVPVWHGSAILPTLGVARLPSETPCSVAVVCDEGGAPEVRTDTTRVVLSKDHSRDSADWWGIRHIVIPAADDQVLRVRLDDLDPYRGLYEPVLPQRLSAAEVGTWRELIEDAWHLIVEHLPETAKALRAALVSLVPRPAIPFRMPSASTDDAFGSAVVGLPADAVSLAATLIHEFQHARLGSLQHFTLLQDEDPRERYYAPWRNDPRPLAGLVHGVYAFFGVTMFWRALARAGTELSDRRAVFEFAYWRSVTWETLRAVRDDSALTPAGRRFIHGIALRLGRWQDEPVSTELVDTATALASDHYAGWRIRHVRAAPETVATVTDAWLAGRRAPAGIHPASDRNPTPVPDGCWSQARIDLVRLRLLEAQPGPTADSHSPLTATWYTVPDVTPADLAYARGRLTEAARRYRAELAADPDRPASWVGLGLALSGLGHRSAGRALLTCPELVRAVHRRIRAIPTRIAAPDELADWIGRSLP